MGGRMEGADKWWGGGRGVSELRRGESMVGGGPALTSKLFSTDALMAVAAALILMLTLGPVQMKQMNLGCFTAGSTANTRNPPNWICGQGSGAAGKTSRVRSRGAEPMRHTPPGGPPHPPSSMVWIGESSRPNSPSATGKERYEPGRVATRPSCGRDRSVPTRALRRASCYRGRC